jgi:hypothetical protein
LENSRARRSITEDIEATTLRVIALRKDIPNLLEYQNERGIVETYIEINQLTLHITEARE